MRHLANGNFGAGSADNFLDFRRIYFWILLLMIPDGLNEKWRLLVEEDLGPSGSFGVPRMVKFVFADEPKLGHVDRNLFGPACQGNCPSAAAIRGAPWEFNRSLAETS